MPARIHYLHQYAIARNARNRPTLQHRMAQPGLTLCGTPLTGWAVHYSAAPLGPLLCRRCERLMTNLGLVTETKRRRTGT